MYWWPTGSGRRSDIHNRLTSILAVTRASAAWPISAGTTRTQTPGRCRAVDEPPCWTRQQHGQTSCPECGSDCPPRALSGPCHQLSGRGRPRQNTATNSYVYQSFLEHILLYMLKIMKCYFKKYFTRNITIT